MALLYKGTINKIKPKNTFYIDKNGRLKLIKEIELIEDDGVQIRANIITIDGEIIKHISDGEIAFNWFLLDPSKTTSKVIETGKSRWISRLEELRNEKVSLEELKKQLQDKTKDSFAEIKTSAKIVGEIGREVRPVYQQDNQQQRKNYQKEEDEINE